MNKGKREADLFKEENAGVGDMKNPEFHPVLIVFM